MHKPQRQVLEFHKTMGLHYEDEPKAQWPEVQGLRCSLIEEELGELDIAMFEKDLVSIADALADLLYVVYGTAVEYGIDMEPIFDEVHRSNMTKVGGKLRKDGKLLKPDSYSPPDLKLLINEQMNERCDKDG